MSSKTNTRLSLMNLERREVPALFSPSPGVLIQPAHADNDTPPVDPAAATRAPIVIFPDATKRKVDSADLPKDQSEGERAVLPSNGSKSRKYLAILDESADLIPVNGPAVGTRAIQIKVVNHQAPDA